MRLFDECDRADREWSDSVRVKIDAAVAMSEHTPPIDGGTFIVGICDRFRQARETQQSNADFTDRQLPGAIDAI